MSIGEMCFLIPNSTRHFEKFNQLRRRSVVPKCLFGPPDPEDTERMFQELMRYNRERMLKTYNVDILDNGPQKGTQLLLVLMKGEPKRLTELRDEECAEVKPVPEEEGGSRLEESERSLKMKTDKSTKSSRNHPYASRQSQLTEFWRCRRHLGFDAPKIIPSSTPSISVPLLSVPRFEEERRRN